MREHLGPDQRPEAEDHDNEADALGLSSLIGTLWDNRWLLVATTGVALAVSAWQLQTETPLYRASAHVVLETRQNNVVNVESVVPGRTLDYLSLNTEIQVLRSSELVARAVEAMSLEQDPEFNPALRPPTAWKQMIGYDRLRQAIGLAPEPRPAPPPPEQAREIAAGILNSKVSISIVPSTFVFNITVETEGPEKSAALANTIAGLYVAGQREAKFEAMDAAMAWLGNRVVELKAELEAAEAEIEDFAAGATLVNEEALLANTQRLKNMRARQAELADTAARLRGRVERITTLRAQADFAGLAEVVEDQPLGAAAAALAAGSTSAGDPALVRFDALLERRLDGLGADAERAEAQAAATGRSVAELAAMVEAQSGDLVTLRQMQREVEATRLIYESFLGRLKEISVQQGIQQADSRVLSPAKPPGAPSHPKVRATLVKDGLLGLVIGFVLIGLRSVLRRSVRTPEELEAVAGLSVIGVIPDDRIRRPDRLLAHIVEKPASRIAEAVRNLRTAIQLSNVDVSPQVIVVTSSVPDEGKSILAAALAQTSALSGKKVLLVDSDLRRRILRQYFHLDAKAGLVRLLSGQASFADVVHRDARTGLDILIADDEKVTPVDFFGSRQFGDLIAEARRSYDLIVLDTPPVLAVPETRVIAQHADAVVYSVRWNSTTRRMVQTGLDLLRQVNVRVTGLALTRIDPRRMDRYGYYGYGHGSGSRKLQKYYSS